MATENRGNGSQQPTAPHFFKVIVAPLNQGLRIPTVFMRKYGRLLGKRVVLKVPPGVSLPVELRQAEDGTWLDKGWLAFAEYYAVDLRHFLVFRYEGNSQFHVLIFKPSSVEIQYPFPRDRCRHEENHPVNVRTRKVGKREEIETHSKEDDDDHDVSVEFLGEEPAPSHRLKKRGRPPGTKKTVSDEPAPSRGVKKRGRPPGTKKTVSDEPAPSRPVKKRGRPPGTKKTVSQVKIEQGNCSCRHLLRSKMKREKREYSPGVTVMPCSPPEQPASPSAEEKLIKKEHHISYLKAKAFKSANPFIVRLIHHYHVNAPFRMTFGLRLARDYLPKDSQLDLIFSVQGSMKCWPVKCYIYTDRAMCKQGWKRFVQDNSLMVGDVCVFELVSGTLRFNTIIYRNS